MSDRGLEHEDARPVSDPRSVLPTALPWDRSHPPLAPDGPSQAPGHQETACTEAAELIREALQDKAPAATEQEGLPWRLRKGTSTRMQRIAAGEGRSAPRLHDARMVLLPSPPQVRMAPAAHRGECRPQPESPRPESGQIRLQQRNPGAPLRCAWRLRGTRLRYRQLDRTTPRTAAGYTGSIATWPHARGCDRYGEQRLRPAGWHQWDLRMTGAG